MHPKGWLVSLLSTYLKALSLDEKFKMLSNAGYISKNFKMFLMKDKTGFDLKILKKSHVFICTQMTLKHTLSCNFSGSIEGDNCVA